MTKKQTITASEPLLKNRPWLSDIYSKYPDFQKEMLSFIRRNQIHPNGYCPRCMRAHAVKYAKSHGINMPEMQNLIERWQGEIGHFGYYLDMGRLIKIMDNT